MKFRPVEKNLAAAMLASMARVPKWDTSAGLDDITAIIGSGDAFAALDDLGEPVMLFVVRQVQHDQGRELLISVALQLQSGADLTASALPEIERVFGAGCDVVTIHTKRPGLVRKLQKSGYAESAKIMRKKL